MSAPDHDVELQREKALRQLTSAADEMDFVDYLIAFSAGTYQACPRQFPRGVDLHIPSAGLQSLLHRWAADVHAAAEALDGDDQ